MLKLIAGLEKSPSQTAIPSEKKWMLRLYVAGQTRKSVVACANLHKICEQYLTDEYHVDVIDLLENPHLAKADQIIAIPTLVRGRPLPGRKIIGDLSDTARVLAGLDLHFAAVAT